MQGISFDKAGISLTREYCAARFVEIGSVDLEKKIFENHHCIFTTSLLAPEENEENVLPPGCYVPSLVKTNPVDLVKSRQFICSMLSLSSFDKGRDYSLNTNRLHPVMFFV